MTNTERQLNTACEIITELETYADADQKMKIESLFNDIKYSDKIEEDSNEQE